MTPLTHKSVNLHNKDIILVHNSFIMCVNNRKSNHSSLVGLCFAFFESVTQGNVKKKLNQVDNKKIAHQK